MLNDQKVCFIFFKPGFKCRRVFAYIKASGMVAMIPSTHAAPAIAGASVFFVHLQGGPPLQSHVPIDSIDSRDSRVPNSGLEHGSEVFGSAWAEPKQDQKALRSC